MRTKLFLCGCFALLLSPLVHGQTPEPTPTAAPVASSEQPGAGGKRVREFQGDELDQVLRLLARQAKINLAVGENVKGLVNVRLEDASAMEAIEVVVHQYKLSMTQDDKGVYYVNLPDPADAVLDLMTKPEMAYRVAAYKHNLYTALMKEGFTPDEAMRIVVASNAIPQK